MRSILSAYRKLMRSTFPLLTDSLRFTSQALHCKAKVLNVIEEEIEEIHRNVGAKKVALRASTMKRVHRANLPMEESQRATELLGKITALDRSRIDLERVCIETKNS